MAGIKVRLATYKANTPLTVQWLGPRAEILNQGHRTPFGPPGYSMATGENCINGVGENRKETRSEVIYKAEKRLVLFFLLEDGEMHLIGREMPLYGPLLFFRRET